MNISTRELRAFLYVAALRSFTRSAERLHITQAGLSAMIRTLETQVGSRLFNRTTRTVSLTETGKSLLPVAQRVVDEIDAIGAQLNEISLKGRLTLRVGATPLVASKLLPLISREFRNAHPEITVKIFEAQREAIQWMTEDGLIDIGLGVFVTPIAGIERRVLRKFRLMYVGSPATIKHRNAGARAALSWSAIPKVPLIGLKADNPIQQLIDQNLKRHGLLPGIDLSFYDIGMETQIAMVASQMGAAIMPAFILPALKNYNVVALPLRPRADIEFYWMIKRGRVGHPAAPAFIDATRTVFGRVFT